MLTNQPNAHKIIITEIPGHDDPQFQEIIFKHVLHASYGDSNPKAACIKYLDIIYNERRNNYDTSANSGNRNTIKNRNDTTNIDDDIIKPFFCLSEISECLLTIMTAPNAVCLVVVMFTNCAETSSATWKSPKLDQSVVIKLARRVFL